MEGTLNKIRLIVLIILFSLAALSCNLFTRPVVTEGPPFEVWTPTVELPVDATPKIVEATVDQPVYARAQIGTYLSIWVTYDPAIWDAIPWPTNGVNQYNEPTQALVYKADTGCTLHDNLGHGVPENWSWSGFTREIAGATFKIDQWIDTNTNSPVLVVYQYPAGEQTNTTIRIELETGSSGTDCINATDVVIGLSLSDITQ
jgi:hypothetical protein